LGAAARFGFPKVRGLGRRLATGHLADNGAAWDLWRHVRDLVVEIIL